MPVPVDDAVCAARGRATERTSFMHVPRCCWGCFPLRISLDVAIITADRPGREKMARQKSNVE
ncbi:hypothetical protein IF1G_03735 [Cordyceps javanica]|uniref:Uncharacterized protein n=1 Tax=Cordyceps javanica TaxID=43265 RepID=A0A545V8E5_9HYPO|nr:hypothetical protein IF1G_03735 [Cordyceps javanica]